MSTNMVRLSKQFVVSHVTYNESSVQHEVAFASSQEATYHGQIPQESGGHANPFSGHAEDEPCFLNVARHDDQEKQLALATAVLLLWMG